MSTILSVPLLLIFAATGQDGPPRTDLYGDPLPPGALARLGTVRFRHPGSVAAIALSPDGKSLATQGEGTVRLWDAATGKPGPVLQSPGNFYGAGQSVLAFSPDGQRVYFPNKDGVAACNPSTGQPEPVFTPGQDTKVHAVHPSPDGKLLGIGTNRGVIVLDPSTGNTRWSTWNGPTAPPDKNDRLLFHGPYSLALFAPDGKLTAVNASDAPKRLRLVDAAAGHEQRQIELGERLVRMAFSPDSRQIAVTERDNAVRIYETATGRRVHSWTVNLTNPSENYTSAVAFSADGATVAAGATDHLIHLWDLRTGRELTPLRGHTWYVSALVFSADGQWLYSGGWDGRICRWEVSTWREKPVASDTATGLVARSPVGSVLAWSADGGVLHFGDAATGKRLQTVAGNPAGFSCLKFSPDGTHLAAGSGELSVQLWEVASGKLLRQWSWPKGRDPYAGVDDIAFTPDGKALATASFRTHEVLLWDVGTGTRLGRAEHEMATGVVFTPDGRTLISAGWDRAVRWWSVPELRSLDAVTLPYLEGSKDPLADPRFHRIASTSDGRWLATINIGGGISLWDGINRKLLHSFHATRGQCQIAFSPNGQWVTTGGYDGELALWEARTGQQALKLAGHPSGVFNVAFSPDGRTLVSGAADRTVLLWDLRPKKEPMENTDVASQWDALAGNDAAVAYRAVWRLAEQPERSVPFLSGKLAPVKTSDVQSLIAALDSDRFAEREKATAELEKLGERTGPALEKLLKGNPSQEAKRRAEAIVAKLGGPVTSPEVLRTLRAIEALEHIGTPEAMAVIEKLAAGAAGARETEDAKRALERLKKRSKK